MNSKGFTLIEFLVVMALIAVLGMLGGNAYFSSLEKGRDAKRIEDMQMIQKAFELYYTNHDNAYVVCSTMGSSMFSGNLPRDPRGSEYYYGIPGTVNPAQCGVTNQEYCVCARLINSQYYSKFGNSTAENCAFANPGAATQYYCVRNVQ